MKTVLSILPVLLVAACALPSQPQTPAEFRAAVKQGPAFARQEVHETPREFTRVVADIDQQARKCLARSVSSRVMQGANMSSSTSTYSPRLAVPGPGRAEFTLQRLTEPRGIGPAMPAGGYYMLLVDIEQVAPQKTRLSIYGGSRDEWGGLFTIVKDWSDGRNMTCPKPA
jgi:hypothetical protein